MSVCRQSSTSCSVGFPVIQRSKELTNPNTLWLRQVGRGESHFLRHFAMNGPPVLPQSRVYRDLEFIEQKPDYNPPTFSVTTFQNEPSEAAFSPCGGHERHSRLTQPPWGTTRRHTLHWQPICPSRFRYSMISIRSRPHPVFARKVTLPLSLSLHVKTCYVAIGCSK